MEDSIYACFRSAVRTYPGRVALRYKVGKEYKGISFGELYDASNSVAASLKALGISRGDTVAILSYNRPEWVMADLAIMKLGGIVVPIYHMPGHAMPANNVCYILNDAKVKVLFVENRELYRMIDGVRAEVPLLKHIILFDDSGVESGKYVRFSEIREREGEIGDVALKPDDVATVVYTSGTTGKPKGVMLTHRNIVSNAAAACRKYHFTPDDALISYLPLAHMFERTCGYYCVLFSGGNIGYARDLTTVAEDIQEIKPTIILAVPRVLEKAYNKVVQQVEASSRLKQLLASAAIRNLNEYVNRRYRKQRISPWLRGKCALFNTLVASKFKKIAGGRVRIIVSGGAPLNRQIAKTFYVLGFNICEGYGLTETAPVVTCNAVEDNRLGTVGRPFPDIEVKIGDNDEVLVRGPNVMKGYLNKPEETAKVLGPDGWFHTGDQGEFDRFGNLVITGRIKELIVTSGGKKIAPAPIEANITSSRYIEQAMLYGDTKKYLVGFVVPCEEELRKYAEEHTIVFEQYPDLLGTNEIRSLIRMEIGPAIAKLASFQTPKAIAILNEVFSVANDMLTPTLKLRRKKVVERYGDLIDLMYQKKVDAEAQSRILFF
jgi:long-chain acyl-CoA synthetase